MVSDGQPTLRQDGLPSLTCADIWVRQEAKLFLCRGEASERREERIGRQYERILSVKNGRASVVRVLADLESCSRQVDAHAPNKGWMSITVEVRVLQE